MLAGFAGEDVITQLCRQGIGEAAQAFRHGADRRFSFGHEEDENVGAETVRGEGG
jgi:hypothetical protein